MIAAAPALWPDADWFLAAATFAVAMAASPGPNKTIVAASGARFGLRRTLPLILGISVGFPVMIVLLALGGSELMRLPWLMLLLKWVGVAYLLWVAWSIAAGAPDMASGGIERPMGFAKAALLQWTNPKSWLTAASSLTTYVEPAGTASHLGFAAALALIFAVVSLPASCAWAYVGISVVSRLKTSRALRMFNLFLALLLLASVLSIVLG